MTAIILVGFAFLACALSGVGLARWVGAVYRAQRNSRWNGPGSPAAASEAPGLPAEPRPVAPERPTEQSTGTKLTLLPLQSDNVFRVRLDGPITLRGTGPEGDALLSLLGPLCFRHHIELDCQRAAGIDTSGVSWLLGNFNRFRTDGGTLVLSNVPPTVRDFLSLLSLGSVFGLNAGRPPDTFSLTASSGSPDRKPLSDR